MNEDNNTQPNSPQPSTPLEHKPVTFSPDETASVPVVQPEATPNNPVENITQPISALPPQPVQQPQATVQEPAVAQNNQIDSTLNEPTYNSNPFIAVGKGLGSALFTNPVATILLAVIPFLIIFPVFFLAGFIGGLSGNALVIIFFVLVALIVSVLVFLRASAGVIIVLLDSAHGNKITTKEAMGSRASKHLTTYFLTVFVMSLAIFFGLLLFIIPGIFLLARLSLAPILIFAEDLKTKEALKRSFAMTKGHAFEILGVQIAQSLISYNGLLATTASYSGLTRRYIELSDLEKSGTASKPKTHWLNFLLPILALLIFIPYIALAIIGASTNNKNSNNSGFSDDFGFSDDYSFSSSASDSVADTNRKNDINSLYQKLEEYYNENGSYPNQAITSSTASIVFPGIDTGALIDENGNTIIVNYDDSPYIINYPTPDSSNQYVLTLYGEGCDGFSADTSCTKYILAGYQAAGFTDYVKTSLN